MQSPWMQLEMWGKGTALEATLFGKSEMRGRIESLPGWGYAEHVYNVVLKACSVDCFRHVNICWAAVAKLGPEIGAVPAASATTCL